MIGFFILRMVKYFYWVKKHLSKITLNLHLPLKFTELTSLVIIHTVHSYIIYSQYSGDSSVQAGWAAANTKIVGLYVKKFNVTLICCS